MVKRKSDSQIPQAQHGKNSQPSQHDKQARLSGSGKQREKTEDAGVPLCGYLKDLADAMGRALGRRIGFRFAIVVAGMMLARGRRTAASWFRHAEVKDDWDLFNSPQPDRRSG